MRTLLVGVLMSVAFLFASQTAFAGDRHSSRPSHGQPHGFVTRPPAHYGHGTVVVPPRIYRPPIVVSPYRYCPPPVVYSPPVVYEAPAVVYPAPVIVAPPVYQYDPGFGFGFYYGGHRSWGFNFGFAH